VAHRSNSTPRAERFKPVAMTISGFACSMAFSNMGQALAKLTGSVTVVTLMETSCRRSSDSATD
jgi:hypothetical protein